MINALSFRLPAPPARRTRICGLALCLLIALFGAALAGAQPRPGPKVHYSESEKVGFAFYRLANRPPPYEDWLKSTDAYKFAKPSAKRELLRRETERLMRGYADFLVDEDLIYIRTKVRVRIPTGRESAVYDNMGLRKPVQILLDGVRENYFPVQVGDMWIALVADKLEDYLVLSLDEDEYDVFVRRMGLDTATSPQRNGILELRLHPVSVDTTAPLSLDGIDAWLMLTEIANIALQRTPSPDSIVWEKSTDWYTPRRQKELMDLYTR